ncbi:MAG: hypothetical protein JWN51_3755 [Phycisphaerales bacterium]|nr:hypothetical protein [Phycisphaerales bacterium]
MSHKTSGINRREALRAAGAATLGLAAGGLPMATALAAPVPRSVLLFAKLSDLPADFPKELAGELSTLVVSFAKANGIALTVLTDGSALTPAELARYDLVVFYTTSNLTIEASTGAKPIPAAGKAALVQAIANGKAFIAEHVGLRGVTTKTPAAGPAVAARMLADAKFLGAHFAAIISAGKSSSLRLADHHVHVKGLTIGKTPLPLRSVSLQATGGSAPHTARPIINVLMSNGGSLLKSTLRVAV